MTTDLTELQEAGREREDLLGRLDSTRERIADLASAALSNGAGHGEVARALGISPQALYGLLDRREGKP